MKNQDTQPIASMMGNAIEQLSSTTKEHPTQDEKREFLLGLVKETYDQGDDYYANLTKKGTWLYGYSNDYPLQHGEGKKLQMKDDILNTIMNKIV